MKKITFITNSALIFLCAILTACKPSEEKKAQWAEKKRIECLDKICEGDVEPKFDPSKETVLKLNGQWFIGPKDYFSTGINGAAFEWWGHKSYSASMKRPPLAQALAVSGNGYDLSVEIFLRSNNIPSGPHGYQFIELAETKKWIADRKTVRPGLNAVTMKHVIGPNNQYIDHVTYYVATGFKGIDGLPPVATCAHDRPDGSGGTGFIWQPGIWAGTRMNQKHCADWPEIYQETIRILQKLRKA